MCFLKIQEFMYTLLVFININHTGSFKYMAMYFGCPFTFQPKNIIEQMQDGICHIHMLCL